MARALSVTAVIGIVLVAAHGDFAEEEIRESRATLSSRWLGRRANTMTCDRFPQVCRATGSQGPDCCRKKCVDVMNDGLNCGECGWKCRYGEVCCGGNCVRIMYDSMNCGGCMNMCSKGSSCLYGLCSYA